MDGIEVKECKDPEWQKYIYIYKYPVTGERKGRKRA